MGSDSEEKVWKIFIFHGDSIEIFGNELVIRLTGCSYSPFFELSPEIFH